jgi:hypothetical protein
MADLQYVSHSQWFVCPATDKKSKQATDDFELGHCGWKQASTVCRVLACFDP